MLHPPSLSDAETSSSAILLHICGFIFPPLHEGRKDLVIFSSRAKTKKPFNITLKFTTPPVFLSMAQMTLLLLQWHCVILSFPQWSLCTDLGRASCVTRAPLLHFPTGSVHQKAGLEKS